MLKIGDTVAERNGTYNLSTRTSPKKVGIVVEILRSEIYDRGERVIVAWSCGGKSYEKENHLEKKN
jgi:hypothetical protein